MLYIDAYESCADSEYEIMMRSELLALSGEISMEKVLS